MAKKLSAATRLKISRSLKGNKNAFSGGPKKSPLSTRQKIANINAATKAKKANLSSDQVARRAAVAKRLRAQARREEALGGGNPGTMKTNADVVAETRAKSDRSQAGGIPQVTQAKTMDNARSTTARNPETRTAVKDGAPRSTRSESRAKVQPAAKQKLNAPQSPPEQQKARIGEMSAATRRRQQASKFEANQSAARAGEMEAAANARRAAFAEERQAARSTPEAKAARVAEQKRVFDMATVRKSTSSDNIVTPGSRKASRGKNPVPSANLEDVRAHEAHVAKMLEENRRREQPKPAQSVTGTDRSGVFSSEHAVKPGAVEQRKRNLGQLNTDKGYEQIKKEFKEADGVDAIDAINFLANRGR